jgi:SNF2 family DNA or RNA helicase
LKGNLLTHCIAALLDHQAAGLEWLKNHPHALLADDVGLGKTVTTAAYLGHLADTRMIATGNRRERALLVVPAALIPQWRGELARFLPGLSVADSSQKTFANPSKNQALANLALYGSAGPDLTVVSYEYLRVRRDVLAHERFRAVVLDEASAVKGRGKEHDAAHDVSRGAGRTLALTATPVEVDLMGTWGILRAVHAPGLPTQQEWGSRYVVWDEGYQPAYGPAIPPKPIGLRPEGLDDLRGYMAQVALRRTAEDTGLQLPTHVGPQYEWVDLTPPQRRAYDLAEKFNGLLRQQRWEEACGWVNGRSAKAEAAVRWLLARPDVDKAVVYAERLDHLTLMGDLLDASRIGWVRIDGTHDKDARADAVTAFRDDPNVRVLLGSSVLQRGLNLQHARVMLSLGSTFNPADDEQRAGRIRRIGSPHATVEHVTFVAKVPYELSKVAKVANRADDATAVLA